jgi:hypothetical protein
MVTFVHKAKNYLIAAGVGIGLAGFGVVAGVASADTEVCSGAVPSATAHMPAYPTDGGAAGAGRVPGAQDAECLTLQDVSDTSMADMSEIGTWGRPDIAEIGTWGSVDIRGAGSYPGNSPAFTAKPQSVT